MCCLHCSFVWEEDMYSVLCWLHIDNGYVDMDVIVHYIVIVFVFFNKVSCRARVGYYGVIVVE